MLDVREKSPARVIIMSERKTYVNWTIAPRRQDLAGDCINGVLTVQRWENGDGKTLEKINFYFLISKCRCDYDSYLSSRGMEVIYMLWSQNIILHSRKYDTMSLNMLYESTREHFAVLKTEMLVTWTCKKVLDNY